MNMAQKVVICGINTSLLPKLSAKDCDNLLVKINQGDCESKELFILANMRLVLSVIKKFYQSKVCVDDLFQAGCIGLIKATDNFDMSVGVKFSTYAVPMILGEVKRVLRARNSLRVSRSIRDTAYQVLKTRVEIEAEDGEVSNKNIADRLNIAEREVVYALDAISDPVSLFDPVYNKQGDTLLLLDQIADEKNTEDNWTEKVALTEAIKKLGDRERKILFLRYYEGKTQMEISSEIGLSQAQVSRLEKNALSQIKNQIKL